MRFRKRFTGCCGGCRRGRDNFRYDVRELQRVLPTMTEKSAPIVQSVARAVAAVMGKEAEYVVSPRHL